MRDRIEAAQESIEYVQQQAAEMRTDVDEDIRRVHGFVLPHIEHFELSPTDIIYQLQEFVRRGGSASSRATVNADELLIQAQGYLQGIKERDEFIRKRDNRVKVEMQ